MKKLLSSVKTKWALIAAGGMLVTFAVFAFLIFYSVQTILLNNERYEIKDLTEEIGERLSRQYYPLTSDVIEGTLEIPEIEVGPPVPSPKAYITNKDSYLPAISLGREGISVSVYNPEGERIYTMGRHIDAFEDTDEFVIFEPNNVSGFVGVAPVYSRYNDKLIGYIQVHNNLLTYRHLMEKIQKSVFVFALIAITLSFIFGYIISQTFTRPIQRLTSAMNDIRSDLTSDLRLEEDDRAGELAEVARSYNNMVDLMQKNIENQKEFVEDVSHELRTPVAVVEGYLTLLNRWGKEDPEVMEESISASLQEMKRMKTLINEMLTLSRAQQVDLAVQDEIVDASELVKQTQANFSLLYQDFSFPLDIDTDEPALVKVGRDHLEQILVIVTENAVKYSTDRPEVRFNVAVERNIVEIMIQDFGLGIAQEDQKKIFNRFYRVDKARSRERGGTGLGLSIAYNLVTGYGGSIQLDSVLDQGTNFRIRFPKAQQNPISEEN